LIATETGLGLVFDPRWRDFPFAGLTMAVVPFWTLAMLNRPKTGTRPLAETVFSCFFGAAALYTAFNEGSLNWQALWTSAAYFLLCNTLWQARAVAVAEAKQIVPVDVPEIGYAPSKVPAFNPVEIA